MTRFLGRLLGIEDLNAIESVEASLSASWAQAPLALFWLLIGCLALILFSGLYYLRYQRRGRTAPRVLLALCRAALLCLLVLVLAEPVMVFKLISTPKPHLWVLFDGTDSMAIQDELSAADRRKLGKAVGLKPQAGLSSSTSAAVHPSRAEYVQSLLNRQDNNLLRSLEEKFRIKTFIFDDGVRELTDAGDLAETQQANAALADRLTTKGQFTALGGAFYELARRQATSRLAGLLVFSDFNQNSGPSAEGAARRLGTPIYTVGIGPAAAMDLRVKLEAPLRMTKAERNEITVTLEQEGVDEPSVNLRVSAIRVDAGLSAVEPIVIADRQVDLAGYATNVTIPYTPDVTGLYKLTAEVDALPGEVIDQNNRAQREVSIRDDFMRLMFVEYEPTWEWRFIKEVFHRDKLVGMRGFRTFLRSADPKVRQYNELFLRTLAPQRSEFFANDVIFLGDMPSSTLSTRFCELTKEFVGKFGGGLVVISGPRFGPGQLANTPLADMLPVVVDPDSRVRDNGPFELRLSPEANTQGFMKLGADEAEMARAWNNLGPLPWYQPVARANDRATVLASHPTDECSDGQPQPLIAVRQYGEGIVVYLGFDETWRLRRKYGERYYRQFWGQMIHQLASRRALGTQKRFIPRTDRMQYRVDDKVVLSVEVYDADYNILPDEKLPEGKLVAEVFPPRGAGGGGLTQVEKYSVTRRRDALFETQIPVDTGGEYRVRIKDPVTGNYAETKFTVTELSAERRSAVRNGHLQAEIALATGGKSYELTNVAKLPEQIALPRKQEVSLQVVSIWNSWWLCFALFCLVVCLMLFEWLARKLMALP